MDERFIFFNYFFSSSESTFACPAFIARVAESKDSEEEASVNQCLRSSKPWPRRMAELNPADRPCPPFCFNLSLSVIRDKLKRFIFPGPWKNTGDRLFLIFTFGIGIIRPIHWLLISEYGVILLSAGPVPACVFCSWLIGKELAFLPTTHGQLVSSLTKFLMKSATILFMSKPANSRLTWLASPKATLR